MQRFNLVNECFGEYSTGTMKQSLEGTYVLHSDAQKEIKQLCELLANLVEDIDQTTDLTILRGCHPYYNARNKVWTYVND